MYLYVRMYIRYICQFQNVICYCISKEVCLLNIETLQGNPVHSKLGIVISDGKSNIDYSDTVKNANIAKQMGINIVSIGQKCMRIQ